MQDIPVTADAVPAQTLSFRRALGYWLRLGFISFGGPAGQIATMHRELVEQRRWISEGRFLHALNYCMVLPGPEAQQLATYIGWLLHRTWGGIAAGTLFVLPSFFILVALSWIYLAYGDVPAVAGIFHGIKPAVTAIVAAAALRIGRRAVRNRWLAAIAALAFLSLAIFAVPFPALILVALVVGAIGGRIAPQVFAQAPAGHAPGTATAAPALIDDHTPPPEHARLNWGRFARTAVACMAIWGVAFGSLVAVFGWQGVYTRMAAFFTSAALLTFGGAYAVLPYVNQGAVDHYHWLTAGQMIDGLALGETTPGPLIMVVTFVGFVGGWTQSPLGPGCVAGAAALGALVATLFTFLPSFFFILLGAPVIEATHGQARLTAPLSAVTAAVVGVIANLALYFALHVFWPTGLGGPVDVPALVICAAAAVALVRYQVGVIPVVFCCGLAGLAMSLAGA